MKPFLFFTILLVCGSSLGRAADSEAISPCTLVMDISGSIGPGTLDYMERGAEQALASQCSSVFLKINTPGGNLATTRKIVELIMNAPIPYLCLISPSGGHAGSAGAIIMQACHVNGGLEATNIGAATPISGNGQDLQKALQKKVYEDTRSWVEGLAKYRERNVDFAREIVLDGKALDARKAAEIGALDTVVSGPNQFLDFAEKMKVRINQDEKSAIVVGPMEEFAQDLRYDTLQILSDPRWAYTIFMASLGLLYFELTHAGVFFPGVMGAIGLVISMINFHMLDVSWGAVALIILGVAFMLAELFITVEPLGLVGRSLFLWAPSFCLTKSCSGSRYP